VATRSARIVASGQDTTGRGGADMKMSSRLVVRSPLETEVTLTSEVNVTGIMAQFGRGMVQDISNQMVGRFTEAVRAQLETPAAEAPLAPTDQAEANPAMPAAPPIEVLSFGGQVVGRAARRAVRRPLFWIAVGAAILVVWLLVR
jgi:uncharacterized protein